jgi:hypothetical protein
MDTISPDIQRAALQLVQHLLKRQDNGTDPVEPEDPGLAPPPNTYNPGDTAVGYFRQESLCRNGF